MDSNWRLATDNACNTIYSLLLHCSGGLRPSPLIPPALTERRYKKCEIVQLHAETGMSSRHEPSAGVRTAKSARTRSQKLADKAVRPTVPRIDPAVLRLIGNTPMVPIHFQPENVTIWAKCEFLNPSGSIKDRFAKEVVLDAEQRGLLKPDSIILECSSGNTGIALSIIGAAKGYRVTILMSEGASQERRQLIHQLGAELILFGSKGRYQTGIEMSREMAAKDPHYFLPRQFENPLNVADHEHGTGEEILRQVPGPIGCFVAGFGTGGLLAGVSNAIKARYPQARIYAMEPAESAVLAGECQSRDEICQPAGSSPTSAAPRKYEALVMP